MATITASMFMALDGVVDPAVGNWHFPYYNDEMGKPAVLAFSSTGRCVISLYASRWDQADLDRVWHHAGVDPGGSWNDAVRYQDLNTKFPGAF